MNTRRHRLRVFLVGLGVFITLVATAAVLLRISRPSRPEQAPRSAAAETTEVTRMPGSHTETVSPDEAGATAAALDYATAPQAWLYMTDQEVRAAVTALAVPQAGDRLADEMVDEIATARGELAKAAGPVWWIVHPLAWKVDSFSQTEATVSVWTFSFLSAADVAMPQTEWTTTTFDLEWLQGSWRVAAVRDTPGPTPAVGANDQPWEPEPLDDALEGFTRLKWGDLG